MLRRKKSSGGRNRRNTSYRGQPQGTLKQMELALPLPRSWDERVQAVLDTLPGRGAQNWGRMMLWLGKTALRIGGEPSNAQRQAIAQLIVRKVGVLPQLDSEKESVLTVATTLWCDWFGEKPHEEVPHPHTSTIQLGAPQGRGRKKKTTHATPATREATPTAVVSEPSPREQRSLGKSPAIMHDAHLAQLRAPKED